MEKPEPSPNTPASKPVEIVNRINRILEKCMPLLAPLGIALALIIPWAFIPLRPFIILFFAVMTFAGALRLRLQELGKVISSPLPIVFFFISARVILPVIIFFLSRLFMKNEPDLVAGFVLLYAVPTAVTSFIWVSIFKGDPALALALIMIDTILAPIVTPGTVWILLRTSVNLDIAGMAVSLIFMILIPTILAMVINEASKGRFTVAADPWLGPLSKFFMLLLIATNSALVLPDIRFNDPQMLLLIPACIVFTALSFVSGKLVGLALGIGKEKQSSIFFASGLKNVNASLTLGAEFFPGPAALPTLLGFVFQQILAAVMGRFMLGKISKDK